MVCSVMPSWARSVTVPFFIRSFAMATASLTGMAKPRPSTPEELYFAVTMPMTCPEVLYTGPPELPALTAASIWNMLMPLSVPSEVVMVRSSALIMPLVMVNSSSPSGLPTA